jgi:hypothetical protein
MRLAQLAPVLFAFAATACTQLTADDDPDPSGGKACTTARVIAGNPKASSSDTTAWDPAGHPAKADPPMHFGNIAQRGRTILVSTGRSIWRLDLDAAAPMFVRVAGSETGDVAYHPTGACADVRFMANEGLAWLPDGRLITGDDWANGVVELSDPLSPSCTAKPIAGTARDLTGTDAPPGRVYMEGDVEGPGASARFAAPNDAITDDAGNVYVWDRGNKKIKRIANDALRTVTTVFTLHDELQNVNAMTWAHGALYAGGINFDGTRVIKINVSTGASAPYVNDADVPRPDRAATAASLPVTMVGQGDDLLVYASGGYLYRIGADGAVAHVAGMGTRNPDLTAADYAGGLPALDVPLHFTDGFVGGGNLTVASGHVLVPTFDDGWGLWDLTCE